MFSGQNNTLVVAAKSGKRITRHYFVPLVIGMIFVVGIFFTSVFVNLMPGRATSVLEIAAAQSMLLIVTFGFVTFLLWLWMRFYEKRSFVTCGFFRTGNIAAKIGRGAFIGAFLITAAFSTAILLGAFTISDAESPNFGIAALPAVLIALVGWIVQGSTEEIAFRGWMLPVMSAQTHVRAGVIVSSLFFALLHALNPGISVLGILNLALFGLFTALYALHEGDIWGVCALHVVWNWTGSNIFGTNISGGNALFGLVSLTPTDSSELLTGGAFGIEGSVITTVVLGVAIGIVWFWRGVRLR
jgi:uncharacterized protein